MGKAQSSDSNPWGCLDLVITIIGLWAVFFGVTIDGKHYGLSCTCAHGVVIDK